MATNEPNEESQGKPSEGTKESRSFQQSVREAWLNVLGAFNQAEGEVHKATQRFLDTFGIGEEGDRGLGAELLARIRKNRAEFERRIDEGVQKAVAKVRAPIEKELASLRARIEGITARIEEERRRAKKKHHDDE